MERVLCVLLVTGLLWWLGPIPAIALALFVVEVVFEAAHSVE